MRLSLALCAALSFAAARLDAADRKTPYTAVIQSDDVYVRSGPGKRYYPTGKLKPGDQVSVHRHDPGGWFMIAPPPGSFSWIPAKYVDRTAADAGTVNANNVVVRIGSFNSDIRDVEQRRLSTGDEVRILGEKMLASEKGTESWYQIAPPRGEFRWILGQFVSPVDAAAPESPVKGPVADQVTSAAPATPATTAQGSTEKPAVTTISKPSEPTPAKGTPAESLIARTGPTAEQLSLERAELQEMDAQFELILARDATQWDFDDLEAAYTEFRDRAPHVAVQRVCDQRLATIAEYRDIQHDYQEFLKVAAQNRPRDKVLSINSSSPAPASAPGTPAKPEPPPAETQPSSDDLIAAAGSTPPAAASPASPNPPAPAATAPPGQRAFRFAGAGIVRQSIGGPAGAPPFVLVAPDGRVLAFLQPGPQVDLGKHLNQPLGVNGPRRFEPALKADLIVVEQVSPVRLAP